MATSNFFSTSGVQRSRRVHTPLTFRSRTRLFTNSPVPNVNAPLMPPGVSPPSSPSSANSSTSDFVLPWESASSTTTLYKSAGPKLSYPAGSRDEDVNRRFLRRMDMYLFSNFQVRQVLTGQRPHPFLNYPRLKQYWAAQGIPNFVFDTRTTFEMMDKVRINGHPHFYQELNDLLWFGGVMSYGNIMREVYAIIFNWIDKDDFHDLEGLCEDDDGPSFRKVVIESLRVVRVQHTQEIIARLYRKLDSIQLIMRPSGMQGYFAKQTKIRLQMRKYNEIVSDSYLLLRTYAQVESKHKKLEEAVAELRRKAGVSKIPTTYVDAKDFLIDTFEFEIPD